MLPSTGYFKTINCPFYENGSCDRPYCHFKHTKREDAGNTAAVASMVETQAAGPSQTTKASNIATSNSDMLQQLVTAAVKKVLADQEVTDTENVSKNIVSQVVEGLKPTLTSGSSKSLETTTANIMGKHISIPTPITKPVPCVYNPTPISELKKRHIPVVSYMPTRETRVAVKRKSSPDRIKPWLDLNQEPSPAEAMEVTYKPTAIVSTADHDSGQSYVPMFKSDSSSSVSYEDSNSNDYVPKIKEGYYPRSKKRREEYVPKKIKAPLKNVQQLDDNILDQFEPEFDMIDEILSAAQTVPASAPPSEESQDYCLDIEPKFSDDESMEDTSSVLDKIETQEHDSITNDNRKEDNVAIKIGVKGKQEREKHKKSYDHCDIKSSTEKSSTKGEKVDVEVKLKKQDDTHEIKDKSKEKAKTNTKHSSEKHKEHRSSSGSRDKEKRDHSSSINKDRNRHKSSSNDKHHLSSHSKDKDKSKSKHSSKSSSHKDKEHSSRTHKESEKDRKDRHKSSRQDKDKSSKSPSKSHSDRHSSSKKHSSRSSQRSSSSTKHSKHKDSSSERNTSEHDERSNSPLEDMQSLLDNDILEVSDSESDVQEECLKIFQEYDVTDHPKVVSVKETPKPEVEDNEEVGRKRVAHPSAATSVTRPAGSSHPPKRAPNPQQKMYERWRLMREAMVEKHPEKAAVVAKPSIASASNVRPLNESNITNKSSKPNESTSTTANNIQLNGNGRIRIAHVAYAAALAREQQKLPARKTITEKPPENKTVAQTTKTGARVAHVPQMVPQLIRPEPLKVTTQKFPLNVRQYYINLMHDICVQIYTNGEDAAQRAVREEFACYEKCKALPVYKNSCMLAAHRLRKEVDQATTTDGPVASASGTVSHEAMLAGKSKGSWSVVKVKRSLTDIKGPVLYSMLKKWILTEQQLRDNSFPRPHPDGPKGRAKVYVINTRNQTVLSKVPNQRICSRCSTPYMVNREGFAVQQQNCIYHWGRKFTIRGESKYNCCQQFGSAGGCTDAKTHVWDYTDYENLRGYVKTLPKDVPVEEQGVYALDCEMCYTTQGLELTRVTVIDEDCKVVYETLVKPQNPIIDYNTRFSGITEENMSNVKTTLLDVQATLLTMFADKTILVGHSLESDFKALRLLHDTVVDTSVMFPHRNGYPQKRALKNLCSEYLRKLIQNDLGGHDSKEDAVACMELIQWKVKEEAKLQ